MVRLTLPFRSTLSGFTERQSDSSDTSTSGLASQPAMGQDNPDFHIVMCFYVEPAPTALRMTLDCIIPSPDLLGREGAAEFSVDTSGDLAVENLSVHHQDAEVVLPQLTGPDAYDAAVAEDALHFERRCREGRKV